MTRIPASIDVRRLAAGMVAVTLVVAACGCRDGGGGAEALQAQRALAERVSGVIDELQKRRSTMQAESDIADVLGGLRINQAPPAPAPDPVEPAETADDPAMTAGTLPEPPKPTYKLQGIAWHPQRPLAIVNKRTVGIGETVDGCRVDRITADGVVLVGPDGEPMELRLYEPSPKQP
ncbi:MAG: hypothetical protein KJ579_09760 [Verrucomicrobia bacterium]|nr:hypothetical protein [Verrucomicrobiota bacterium]